MVNALKNTVNNILVP